MLLAALGLLVGINAAIGLIIAARQARLEYEIQMLTFTYSRAMVAMLALDEQEEEEYEDE